MCKALWIERSYITIVFNTCFMLSLFKLTSLQDAVSLSTTSIALRSKQHSSPSVHEYSEKRDQGQLCNLWIWHWYSGVVILQRFLFRGRYGTPGRSIVTRGFFVKCNLADLLGFYWQIKSTTSLNRESVISPATTCSLWWNDCEQKLLLSLEEEGCRRLHSG